MKNKKKQIPIATADKFEAIGFSRDDTTVIVSISGSNVKLYPA
jgi:hypothetical protein